LPESITREAERITHGDRNDSYGPPEDDLKHIGEKWRVTLSAYFREPVPEIPAYIVALLMIDLKTVREAHQVKRDNRVDVVGYAICLDRSVPPQEAS
jgi:hypothetical protein